MIARLFIYIYNRTSFTFAIAIFTTTWSWIGSIYSLIFVFATVNFTIQELVFLWILLFVCTLVAIVLHLGHMGMFYKLGCGGFSKSIRLLNRFFDKKYIFKHYKTIDRDEIQQVYSAISFLPQRNSRLSVIYTTCVIAAMGSLMYYFNYGPEKIFMISLSSIFALLIIGYFTFLLTEYFSGPYRMRLQQILYERAIKIESRNLLSFREKAASTLILIFVSMIILTILVHRSDKSMLVIFIFIVLSVITVGVLISMMLNTIRISLVTINHYTKRLVAGGSGMFFPPFPDKDFTIFSTHYNRAAEEINDIRSDLEKKIHERTVELSGAYDRLNKVFGQIQADLTLARRIQKKIMPDNLGLFAGIDMVVHYYPMADIGGDIYDISSPGPRTVRIFLADAIGHGIQAALITMIIKSEYEKVKTIDNARELLEWLNRSFTDLYISLNAFFSCIVLDIDIENRKIRYASAGHPDQVHVNGSSIELLKHTGKLIGIMRDTQYELVERDLHKNDKVFLYTDGLFEQYNDREELFTENDILDLINMNKTASVREMDNSIISKLREFMGGSEISRRDDITLISIEITE